MSGLSEFLLDRIAEDEAVARKASTKHGRWEVDDEGDHPDPEVAVYPERGGMTTIARTWRTEQGRADAEHIARHDPSRVLAECEARRRIVGLLGSYNQNDVEWWALDDALRLLALSYRDHPDYREEWRL